MAQRAWFGAAVLVATLFLASCGGGSDGGGSDGGGSDGGGGSSPSASASGGSGTGTPGPTDGGGDGGFSYTPWGPDDPPIPGQYAGFAGSSSQDLDCNAVEDQAPDGEFWQTAAAVCHAIRGDAPWPNRTTVPDPPRPENAYQGCLDAELAAMLASALRWHADNPDGQPEISYPARSATSPCQSQIYGTRVLTVSDVESLDVGQDGRIAVALIAPPGQDGQLEVAVDGQQPSESDVSRNDGPGDGLEEVLIFLDPPPEPRVATVEVSNGRATMTASVNLPEAGGSGTPSVTESPPPSDQPSGQDGSPSGSAPPG